MKDQPAASTALAQTARFLDWSGRLAAVGVFEWLPGLDQLTISDKACDLLGLPPAGVPTLQSLLACFDADGRVMLKAAIQVAADSGTGWDAELALQSGCVLRVMGGCEKRSPLRIMVALQDISERIVARAALEEALANLELATHSGCIGVWHYELSSQQLGWDENMRRLHGDATELECSAVQQWRELLHPADLVGLAGFDATWAAALAGLKPLEIAFRAVTPLGEIHHLRCAAHLLRDRQGQPVRLTGVCWDETPLRREAQALHRRATHDSLTGLVNRAEFSERLQRLLSRAGVHVVLALDLDHFKAVNDSYGHAAGDAVLRQVATTMQHCLRDRDTLARLGGDEFAALLAHCSLTEGQFVARKIQDALQREHFSHAGKQLRVGVSIGVAVLAPGATESEVMAAADSACLAAKAAARQAGR